MSTRQFAATIAAVAVTLGAAGARAEATVPPSVDTEGSAESAFTAWVTDEALGLNPLSIACATAPTDDLIIAVCYGLQDGVVPQAYVSASQDRGLTWPTFVTLGDEAPSASPTSPVDGTVEEMTARAESLPGISAADVTFIVEVCAGEHDIRIALTDAVLADALNTVCPGYVAEYQASH